MPCFPLDLAGTAKRGVGMWSRQCMAFFHPDLWPGEATPVSSLKDWILIKQCTTIISQDTWMPATIYIIFYKANILMHFFFWEEKIIYFCLSIFICLKSVCIGKMFSWNIFLEYQNSQFHFRNSLKRKKRLIFWCIRGIFVFVFKSMKAVTKTATIKIKK